MNYTHNNVSAKALRAAKGYLGELIETAAGFAASFDAMRRISEDNGCPLDSQIMEECESLMTTMNRLLYEQESLLKHRQMMQISYLKAERAVSAAVPAGASLFNEAI